jgi:hypothetical protein
MAETIIYRWITTMVKPTQGATQNAQIMAMSQGLSGKVQSSTPHNTNIELKNRSSLSVNPANAQLKSSHLQAQLPCSENAEIRQHK